MPSSLIFTGLVVLWLLILVPAVARHQQEVAHLSGASLAGRVLDAAAPPDAGVPTGTADRGGGQRGRRAPAPSETRPTGGVGAGTAGRAGRRADAAVAALAGARDAGRRGPSRARRRRRSAIPTPSPTSRLRRARTTPTTPLGAVRPPLPARPRRFRPRGRRRDRPPALRLPPARRCSLCWCARCSPVVAAAAVPRGVVGARRDRPRAGRATWSTCAARCARRRRSGSGARPAWPAPAGRRPPTTASSTSWARRGREVTRRAARSLRRTDAEPSRRPPSGPTSGARRARRRAGRRAWSTRTATPPASAASASRSACCPPGGAARRRDAEPESALPPLQPAPPPPLPPGTSLVVVDDDELDLHDLGTPGQGAPPARGGEVSGW